MKAATLFRLLLTYILNVMLLLIGNLLYSNRGLELGPIVSSTTATTDETEKRKRERIDTVLRDLSNDDLVQLRRRLSTMDDDDLYEQLVGDDGELMVNHR